MGMSLSEPHCAMSVCIHICLLVATDQKFELNGLEGYVMVQMHFKFVRVFLQFQILSVHDNGLLLSNSMLMDLLSARKRLHLEGA